MTGNPSIRSSSLVTCFTCIYVWIRLISVSVHASLVTPLIIGSPGKKVAPDPLGRGIAVSITSLFH